MKMRNFSENVLVNNATFHTPTRLCNLTPPDCAPAIIIEASDRDDIAIATLFGSISRALSQKLSAETTTFFAYLGTFFSYFISTALV